MLTGTAGLRTLLRRAAGVGAGLAAVVVVSAAAAATLGPSSNSRHIALRQVVLGGAAPAPGRLVTAPKPRVGVDKGTSVRVVPPFEPVIQSEPSQPVETGSDTSGGTGQSSDATPSPESSGSSPGQSTPSPSGADG